MVGPRSVTSRKGGAGRERFRRGAPGTNHAHRSVPLLHDPLLPARGTPCRHKNASSKPTRKGEGTADRLADAPSCKPLVFRLDRRRIGDPVPEQPEATGAPIW